MTSPSVNRNFSLDSEAKALFAEAAQKCNAAQAPKERDERIHEILVSSLNILIDTPNRASPQQFKAHKFTISSLRTNKNPQSIELLASKLKKEINPIVFDEFLRS